MLRRTVVLGGLGAAAVTACAQAAAPAVDGPRLAAAKGPAKWLVVLCHGYGGDGADMFGLAPLLQRYLPEAAFWSPDGPVSTGGGGRAWYADTPNSPDPDWRAKAQIAAGPGMNAFLDAELARMKLPPERLILLGFSQGAATTLNTGLRRAVPPAGLIAFAGNVVAGGIPQGRGAPPVLLIVGGEDPGQRNNRQATSLAVLKAAGVPAQGHVLPGIGHTIDDRGIRLAGEFLQAITRGKA